MLNAIISAASLRYRMVVVAVSLAVLGYGTYVSTTLPIDVFPDLDRPRVVILTECFGLATEEVETLVTQPIEVSLLGANGVQAVRSQSAPSLSVIYVEFDWTTEVRAARQTVQERLSTTAGTTARRYPATNDAAHVHHGADRDSRHVSRQARGPKGANWQQSARPASLPNSLATWPLPAC